jgi:hypothetical protein
MNAPEKIRLTEFSHGGGCGCKIAPAVLTEILSQSEIRNLPKDLLVGTETADDAAVYRLNDSQAPSSRAANRSAHRPASRSPAATRSIRSSRSTASSRSVSCIRTR